MQPLRQRTHAQQHDVIAPDGSEIRLLLASDRASMVHCTLPAGRTSLAVRHRSVEEVWYVLEGEGEIWRRRGDESRVERLAPGVAVDIPLATAFQFRTTGRAALKVLIATIPPWPGEDEAVRVPDHWPPQ